MHVSPAGRAAITAREGRRLTAYRDSRGIWTIGVGHARTLGGRPLGAGVTITEVECDALLAADLAPLDAMLAATLRVPVTQNEWDALASLGFNIGVAALRRSTVIRTLNAGDSGAAADAFLLWCKPAVLIGRRQSERKQFLTPDATAPSITPTRAAAVSREAVVARTKARCTAVGGTVTAAAAATAGAAASTGPHGVWAWIVGVAIAAGALLDGYSAVRQRQAAVVLAGNAGALAAAVPRPPSTTEAHAPALPQADPALPQTNPAFPQAKG